MPVTKKAPAPRVLWKGAISFGLVHIPVALYSATVDHGDIDVEFTGAAPRTLQAITRRGDVEVELPGPGPYDVRAQGNSTTVRVPETTDAGAPQVTARSERGDVTVDQRR